MNNKVALKNPDEKYFTMVPRIVWAKAEDPYDLILWVVIKDIAGSDGECYLSTVDLAELTMMSIGKVSQCRKRLMKNGLLEGECRKDPGYPQPVWHLTIPDLWKSNVEWSELHPKLRDRVEFKKSLHVVKAPSETSVDGAETDPSPHVEPPSPPEVPTTPPEVPITPHVNKEYLKEQPEEKRKEKPLSAVVTAEQIIPTDNPTSLEPGNNPTIIGGGTIPIVGNGKHKITDPAALVGLRAAPAVTAPIPAPSPGPAADFGDEEVGAEAMEAAVAGAIRHRKRTAKDDALDKLENAFSKIFSVPLPDRVLDRDKKEAYVRWWHPLEKMWRMCDENADQVISIFNRVKFRLDQRDDSVCAAPQSILNYFIDERRKVKGQQAANEERAKHKLN